MNERYGRQTILPGVGVEGQEKWGKAFLILAGEGAALEAAATALAAAGVYKILILSKEIFQIADWSRQCPKTLFECLEPSLASFPQAALALVVTKDAELRRRLNRVFRTQSLPAFFAWGAGSGYALFHTRYVQSPKGKCPCLECFEVMNPKAFSMPAKPVERLLAATAASEALQWVLSGQSPLENKVWVTSLSQGVSFHHEVQATPKCPARLIEEGAKITP